MYTVRVQFSSQRLAEINHSVGGWYSIVLGRKCITDIAENWGENTKAEEIGAFRELKPMSLEKVHKA